MSFTDQRPSWRVATKLEQRSLLLAVNCVAGLAIYFFGMPSETRFIGPHCNISNSPGYDQGMMGGVNTLYDYVNTMKFGFIKAKGTVVVRDTLLQGGIVSVYYSGTLRIKSLAIACVWGIIGALLQCSAQNSIWMICASPSQRDRHWDPQCHGPDLGIWDHRI
ncbi:hypothetical protein BGW36DRAFT_357368 [Talaromyces proteolyticus]|uniref:Uncharacterized protein n=1 Tax=Talaromyces proteolyticus TaxID=1131652 RepID=A0AAD4Q2T4_9EURO|nr:uncharacterized protein BGW36DRAFT_357368 [Talaromyces proteolyticus]KAH8700717.1 hypothetical protein BGW36DRAFT_357368 [Talaromyces proteolyticus]